MSDVYLTRSDEARNMARYHCMTVQPTLFGEWALVREWGRIGRSGQVRSVAFADRAQADRAMVELKTVKERRGYHR